MAIKVGEKKVKKPKKLTAKTALELLVGNGNALPVMQAQADGFSEGICYHIDCHISEEQYKQILDILAPKEKKSS